MLYFSGALVMLLGCWGEGDDSCAGCNFSENKKTILHFPQLCCLQNLSYKSTMDHEDPGVTGLLLGIFEADDDDDDDCGTPPDDLSRSLMSTCSILTRLEFEDLEFFGGSSSSGSIFHLLHLS
mmetsp:Transcript_27752/g.69533  ORF Transcript_27752/g.69533 Transcript_27752/m.69533 type:complete len:123 (+) Transcript_27752:378-746(+)